HLRDDSRHMDLLGEEPPGAREGGARGFLDTRAGRVQEPHDRLAVAQGELAHPSGLELLPHRAHRAGHHGEVVGDDPDLAAVDLTMAGDHAVGRGGVGAVAVLGEEAELDEGPAVEEEVDALARCELAALVLLGDLVGAAHAEVLLLLFVKLLDPGLVIAQRSEFWQRARPHPGRAAARPPRKRGGEIYLRAKGSAPPGPRSGPTSPAS